MTMNSGFSRRGFLKGLGAAVGAAVGTRIPGASLLGEAHAATEPTSLVIIHFIGGFNAIFASAGTLTGSFGVTANPQSANTTGNWTRLTPGMGVDNTLVNAMPAFSRTHAAAVGVRHGLSSHPAAQASLWTTNGKNSALMLASAMGGTASIKAAVVGGNLIQAAPKGVVDGISFQSITDMQTTIEALGGGAPNPRVPDRTIALAGVEAAQAMSANALTGNPDSLSSLDNGYQAAVGTLKQPVQAFDFEALRTAYALGGTTAVNSFKAKLAAAELMVRAGTTVVSLFDGGWDTHGDRTGTRVREKMTTYVRAPLQTFLTRMVQDPSRNVVVCLMGDFSRSLPGSDHQPNLSALVIGRYVKLATSGTVDASVRLPAGTPSSQGLWSYLASVTKTAQSPFGANQHPNLVL
jgi:hypothetical protein